jgi:ribulose kinase
MRGGLTLAHSRAHLLAVALGTRAILENLTAHGFALGRLVAGGGARAVRSG